MEYKIKEVSEITNISQSKIRYYEKEGLLPDFNRDKNNICLLYTSPSPRD